VTSDASLAGVFLPVNEHYDSATSRSFWSHQAVPDALIVGAFSRTKRLSRLCQRAASGRRIVSQSRPPGALTGCDSRRYRALKDDRLRRDGSTEAFERLYGVPAGSDHSERT
jgi:hypothetical protein